MINFLRSLARKASDLIIIDVDDSSITGALQEAFPDQVLTLCQK